MLKGERALTVLFCDKIVIYVKRKSFFDFFLLKINMEWCQIQKVTKNLDQYIVYF